jgi:hypothetical protein
VLDLGGQRERDRPLPPFVEVGVAAPGDDDVRERVGRLGDVGDRLRVRDLGEAQLEHADRLAAAGHRRVEPGAATLLDDVDGLLLEGAPVRGARQGDALAGLAPLAPGRLLGTRVTEPDERVAAEVGDQEADCLGGQRLGQVLGDRGDRLDRRGGFGGGEQAAHAETRGRRLTSRISGAHPPP